VKSGPGRLRVDDWLIEKGLVGDRRQALALLLSGRVRIGSQPVTQPGTFISRLDELEVDPEKRYVSRGGEKLEPILRAWEIVVDDRICLDIGASTGGFSDCLLQCGARLVYALDVGRGQLDWSLRNHSRVRVLEGINARRLTPDLFDPRPTLVTLDVSFISVSQILPPLLELRPLEALILVKPQFEATRQEIPTGGVIHDAALRARIVDRVKEGVRRQGYAILAEALSPLKGQKGNLEVFLHLKA